jgi:hypothetical protein
VPAAAVPEIWQLVKVATPATAAMVGKPEFEHDNDPAPGPEAMAKVTLPVSVVTTLPAESSTETLGEVAKLVASTTPPTGWVVKTSWLGAPDASVTLVVELVAVQVCHTAVTVKLWLPAARPASVQLVAVVGAPDGAQVPAGVPPSAVT